MSIKGQGHSLTFVKGRSDNKIKARFHVTVKTQINKSMIYFIVRGNVKFRYSEC